MSAIATTGCVTYAGSSRPFLTERMLAQFADRVRGYDRDNRFFVEDFQDLREAGYLQLAVPAELGGMGFSLAEVVREQRRLAYYAAPTALAINMHLYWTGVAADLWRSGDQSLSWLLEAATHGAVFAAGHAESGNDIPVLLSTTKAERVDGGYRFTGRKQRLAVQRADSDPEGCRLDDRPRASRRRCDGGRRWRGCRRHGARGRWPHRDTSHGGLRRTRKSRCRICRMASRLTVSSAYLHSPFAQETRYLCLTPRFRTTSTS